MVSYRQFGICTGSSILYYKQDSRNHIPNETISFVLQIFLMVFLMLGGCCLCVVGKVDPHVRVCVVVYLFVLDQRSSFGSILNFCFID